MGAMGGGGGGGGSEYKQDISRTNTFGPTSFGDVNVGAGAGNGLKLSPLMLAIGGAVLVAIVFLYKRFA